MEFCLLKKEPSKTVDVIAGPEISHFPLTHCDSSSVLKKWKRLGEITFFPRTTRLSWALSAAPSASSSGSPAGRAPWRPRGGQAGCAAVWGDGSEDSSREEESARLWTRRDCTGIFFSFVIKVENDMFLQKEEVSWRWPLLRRWCQIASEWTFELLYVCFPVLFVVRECVKCDYD